MKPPDEVRAEFVRQWLGKAKKDLHVCRRLEGDVGLLAAAGFHAQQAVEKALKAFLVWHQIEFSKSHDIGRILEVAASADAELAARVSEAKGLTAYAVQYRYPGDLPEPTAEEIRNAIGTAERVLAEVVSRLPGQFREALGIE